MAESLIKKIKSKGPKLLSVDAESIPWSNYYLKPVVTVMPGGQKKILVPEKLIRDLLRKGERDILSFSLLIKDMR